MKYLKTYKLFESRIPAWWNEKLSEFISDVFIPISDNDLKCTYQDQGDKLIFYITRNVLSDLPKYFNISIVKDEVEHLIGELESEYGYKLYSIESKKPGSRDWNKLYNLIDSKDKSEIFMNDVLTDSFEIKFIKK